MAVRAQLIKNSGASLHKSKLQQLMLPGLFESSLLDIYIKNLAYIVNFMGILTEVFKSICKAIWAFIR